MIQKAFLFFVVIGVFFGVIFFISIFGKVAGKIFKKILPVGVSKSTCRVSNKGYQLRGIKTLNTGYQFMKICKSHVTQLEKVTIALAYKQKMDSTHLILSAKNKAKFEKANNLIHEAIRILQTVK